MNDPNLSSSGRNYLTQEVFVGGEILADRYRIKSFIGKGGMGEVYLAEHVFTGQESAIKVLPLRRIADSQMRLRMQREAAAGTKVSHTNLVQVRDGGITADNVVYIAMEYVGEHRTLRDYMNASGRLSPSHWIAYAIQIAEGLAACHAAEVWHRDIKPENILVLPGARLKIIDLGLARVRTEALRTTGVGDDADGKKRTFATPLYASPEQLFPEKFKVSEKTDIWSLGTVIFEMASGRHLWQQVTNEFPNATEASYAMATRMPPRLADVVSTLPADLSALVGRCHQKDPSARPSAAELATKLAEWLQWARREPQPGKMRPPEAITDPLSIKSAGVASEPSPVPIAVLPPIPDDLFLPKTIGVAETNKRVLVNYRPGELPDTSTKRSSQRGKHGTQLISRGDDAGPSATPVPAQDTVRDDDDRTELYMKAIAAGHAAPTPAALPAALAEVPPGAPVVDTDVTHATTGRSQVLARRSSATWIGIAISLVLVLIGSVVIVLRARAVSDPSGTAAEPQTASAADPPSEAALATQTASVPKPTPTASAPASAASLATPPASPTLRAVSGASTPNRPVPSPPRASATPGPASSGGVNPFFLGKDRVDTPPAPAPTAAPQGGRTQPTFIILPEEAP